MGLDADGVAGRIIVVWNSIIFVHKQTIQGVFSVSVELWCLYIH